jgi:translation initiation factor 1A
MPKNKKGGKNAKRAKGVSEEKRELVFKEDGQDYGIVDKMLGNGWVAVTCSDGEKRNAHIRGSFRKKVWINVGDVLLLGLRDFQDEKSDIILKYTPDEARLLKSYGELADNVKINENEQSGDEDQDVDVDFEIDDI